MGSLGVSFWGMVIYAVVFVTVYFIWAIRKNDQEQ